MDVVLWKYGPAVRAARALPGFLSGWSASRFRGLASGRSAARLARLVRDQEVGGSNPLAPTENQMLDGLRVSSISFREPLVDSLPLIAVTRARGRSKTSDRRDSYNDRGKADE